jgi:hypothetical protein
MFKIYIILFISGILSCEAGSTIENKQIRTNWAHKMAVSSSLPLKLENGVIWDDVFHADAIDTLVYSYRGKANANQVKTAADRIWQGTEGKQIRSMGFTDIIYLWINKETKRPWGVYSSKDERWYQTLGNYTATRGK